MKIRTEQVIDVHEWDKLVQETYGRPYMFQQQNGCQDRGTYHLTVPSEGEDFDNDTLPEIVNHDDMGVSFDAWLKRDPKAPLKDEEYNQVYSIGLWWARNFYPSIEMVANDLHAKGLLPTGEFSINIDW